ncbi:hypothetical protein OG589_04060 [Sphaerisporangium sp. NBC_01403]|uniref:beta-xylosidase family glycoside hydrolase n=1 Tax=Sphaerisporangium sp. NBC_01403 TaxID=2903599 RepID=UPI003247745F
MLFWLTRLIKILRQRRVLKYVDKPWKHRLRGPSRCSGENADHWAPFIGPARVARDGCTPFCPPKPFPNPSLVARRQRHAHFAVHAAMEFTPSGGERAGLALVQNDDFHILLVMTTGGLVVVRREGGADRTQADVPGGRLWLGVEAHEQEYQMSYAISPGEWHPLGEPVDGRVLSTSLAGGFIGAYIGMYLPGEGHLSDNVADFHWFEYLPLA